MVQERYGVQLTSEERAAPAIDTKRQHSRTGNALAGILLRLRKDGAPVVRWTRRSKRRYAQRDGGVLHDHPQPTGIVSWTTKVKPI